MQRNEQPRASRDNGDIQILTSWKDIAKYLNCGVRTVQRWEEQFQMPIRRPAGNARGSVVAFKSDIDNWLRSSVKGKIVAGMPEVAENLEKGERLELLNRARGLRKDVMHSRVELSSALQELVGTLEKMVANSEGGSKKLPKAS
jgi:hypothetical protein